MRTKRSLAGDFDTLAFALGVNLVDHVVINGEECLADRSASPSAPASDGSIHGMVVWVDARAMHKRQPIGLPFDEGVEEIEDDRLELPP